jgi:phosphate transport system substrate-binding protein
MNCIHILLAITSGVVLLSAAENPSTSPQLSLIDGLAVTEGLREFSPTLEMSGSLRCLGSGIAAVTVVSLSRALREVQPEVHLDLEYPHEPDLLPILVRGDAELVVLPYVPSAEVLQQAVGKDPGRDLIAVPFAIDPVVFYVNAHNPVPSLSLAQVRTMFGRNVEAGERAATWGDVGASGPVADKPVIGVMVSMAFDRNSYFRKNILQIESFRLDLRFAPTPGAALCEVGADAAAFSITSLLYATAATRVVPLMLVDGTVVTADVAAVQAKKYPLTRTLTLVARKRDGQLPPLTREVLSYVISRRAQRQMASLGIFPITEEMQRQALAELR